MNPLRHPAHAVALALVAAYPAGVLAQGQIIQRIESRLAPATVGTPVQQGTVVQQGQALPPGTIVQAAPVTTTVAPAAPTIGSHQIDRYEAIRQLQADLASDANNAANWTILGELAHEVALELPQGQDDTYYTLSRQAYERANQLDPNNPGLRAAVQFAREQETNSATFDARRRQGVATYLESRRREMTLHGINPTVLVYEPSAAPTTVPAGVGPNGVQVNSQATTVVQPYATAYPTPSYRPYYNQQAQQPLGYNQYSNGYTPTTGGNGAQTVAPTTLRQYGQQLPGVILNQGTSLIGRPR